ncbi:MAG: hypothetical protein NTU44_06330 [Bacteroidetes bacterium]|nr:hypothetical protein [Bacteroidota bacterium]
MKDLVNNLNELKFNIRAEAIIADLMGQGIDPESIEVQFCSSHKKNWDRDILKYEERNGKIYVKVSRDGIFTSLPEYLFFIPVEGTKTKIEEAIAFNREQREFFSILFSPVENEMIKKRVELEGHFNLLISKLKTHEAEFLHQFWKTDDKLDAVDAARLCKMLPLANTVVGNFGLTARFLSYLIEEEVEWQHKRYVKQLEPTSAGVNASGLGNNACGMDMLMTGPVAEYVEVLIFTINNIPLQKGNQFLEGGGKYHLLQRFADYFVPFHYEVEFKLNVLDAEADFQMGESFVGFNTKIN